jgi:hypothetical protein
LTVVEKPPSAQAIDIGCLTSLRHLLIDIPTWIKRDMIQYLAHVLQNMNPSSPVETITILIIVSEECTLHNWEDAAKWQALDIAFSRLTSAALVEVKIQVHSNEGRLEDITGLDLIERGLPGLVSRGILEVEKIPGTCSVIHCHHSDICLRSASTLYYLTDSTDHITRIVLSRDNTQRRDRNGFLDLRNLA